MSKTKTSQSPHNHSFHGRVRLRVASTESCQRIYDNKTYKHQLNKLFDPMQMLKTLTKKHSPTRHKELFTSFISPVPNNISQNVTNTTIGDISMIHPEPRLVKETPSLHGLPRVTRQSLSVGKHKRAISVHINSDLPPRSNSRTAPRTRKSPMAFLNNNALDITNDSVTHKQGKASPLVRPQLFQNSTKGGRAIISFPPRHSHINKTEAGSVSKLKQAEHGINHIKEMSRRRTETREEYERGLRYNTIGWKQTGNITEIIETSHTKDNQDSFLEDIVPNMEDTWIIQHEIEDSSRASLILDTSEDNERAEGNHSVQGKTKHLFDLLCGGDSQNTRGNNNKQNTRGPVLKNNYFTSVKQEGNSHYIPPQRINFNKEPGARAVRAKIPSAGSPYGRGRREIGRADSGNNNIGGGPVILKKSQEREKVEKYEIKERRGAVGSLISKGGEVKQGKNGKEETDMSGLDVIEETMLELMHDRLKKEITHEDEEGVKKEIKKNVGEVPGEGVYKRTFMMGGPQKKSSEKMINKPREGKYSRPGHKRGISMVGYNKDGNITWDGKMEVDS